jgi:hypothetical protein
VWRWIITQRALATEALAKDLALAQALALGFRSFIMCNTLQCDTVWRWIIIQRVVAIEALALEGLALALVRGFRWLDGLYG